MSAVKKQKRTRPAAQPAKPADPGHARWAVVNSAQMKEAAAVLEAAEILHHRLTAFVARRPVPARLLAAAGMPKGADGYEPARRAARELETAHATAIQYRAYVRELASHLRMELPADARPPAGGTVEQLKRFVRRVQEHLTAYDVERCGLADDAARLLGEPVIEEEVADAA